jgi:cytoplasmic iron level regulating protein YaaA (DUF328/UPF0246 family)
VLALISPAKTLDLTPCPQLEDYSQPVFIKQASYLAEHMRSLDSTALMQLMNISRQLAELNVERFQQWHTPFSLVNAKPAILTFKGDVYQGLAAEQLTAADLAYAQQHLAILSGLYGLLKPLDLIQAYRLEMGIKLITAKADSLYDYWTKLVTQAINQSLTHGKHYLINLASQEYFKVVDIKAIRQPVVTPVFKEKRAGVYKIISFNAKKARGMMCRFMIDERLTRAEDLKAFSMANYRFNKQLSTEWQWVFTRETS